VLEGKRILLVIAGGIAAYKSLDLIRRLRERGASVRCILTKGGAEFVTPLAVAALSEEKVYQHLFSLTDESEMGHIPPVARSGPRPGGAGHRRHHGQDGGRHLRRSGDHGAARHRQAGDGRPPR